MILVSLYIIDQLSKLTTLYPQYRFQVFKILRKILNFNLLQDDNI